MKGLGWKGMLVQGAEEGGQSLSIAILDSPDFSWKLLGARLKCEQLATVPKIDQ